VTPTRLREVLDALRWSQRDLAAILNCDDRLIRRWASGEITVPPLIAVWLARRLCLHAGNPPPDDWRRRPAA